jgi:acyl-coenzyme A thioesterase PaaI-like protein
MNGELLYYETVAFPKHTVLLERTGLMPESFKTHMMRWGFNLFPAFRGTGARITYIAGDWREVRVKLPLSWRTRNYVGTIYGGSMYAAVDPFYMVMLIKLLGPDYVVWDKAASIRFRKPGTGTLYATFLLTDDELRAIHDALAAVSSVERVYQVELVDDEGVVHALIDKTVHIRKKERVVKEREG